MNGSVFSSYRVALSLLTLTVAALAVACGGGSSQPEDIGTVEPRATAAAWPENLELGAAVGLGVAPPTEAPLGFRYQYLAGGAGTGNGWQTWGAGGGSFVASYIAEARRADQVPVFTYYMLLQTTPEDGSEPDRLEFAVGDAATMKAWFDDLRAFFERANEAGGLTVLHVEPDLWGFLQQRNRDARKIDVEVRSTGIEDFADLPDTAAGMAQAVVALRDRYAPNVQLGFHFSAWATGQDPFLANTTPQQTAEVARESASFYRSLGAEFDVAFTEFSDRDAGFKEVEYGDRGASWWDANDFDRHVTLLDTFHRSTGLPLVLWQIPYGNTVMRALNNTWNHYQDNRVEWLLGDDSRAHLEAYRNVGVVAFLFGRGADGATDASDAAADGVTDPEPINGNERPSLSAADDGGYFAERSQAYYEEGPLPLLKQASPALHR